MIPTVGRIVHYTNLGDKDGKYPPEQQAAIVTKVTPVPALPEGPLKNVAVKFRCTFFIRPVDLTCKMYPFPLATNVVIGHGCPTKKNNTLKLLNPTRQEITK